MPRGDKSKYTDKQKRRAEHIAESYSERGVSEEEARRRAWATVNAESHGGEKPGGSGYGQPETHQASRRGGQRSLAGRTKAQRSAAAKKAAATRKRKAAATPKQRAAARKNVKKAAVAAKRKGTLKKLPKSTRTALAKQANKVKREKARKA